MAQRTYAIGLYLAFNAAYRYATRWQPKLQASLTAQQYQCVQAVIAALTECLPLIQPPPPND